MSNVVAFTPRPLPSEPTAPAPLALRAHLEEAAQTALDVADKIIAALNRIEDGADAPAVETALAVSAQVVHLGDLGSFVTSIARPREETPAIIEEPQNEAQAEPAATAEIRDLFPPLPWGGAGNVISAAGCALLTLVAEG